MNALIQDKGIGYYKPIVKLSTRCEQCKQTLNPCYMGIVLCERMSLLNICVLFRKDKPKTLSTPIFAWKVKMDGMLPIGLKNFLFKVLMELD